MRNNNHKNQHILGDKLEIIPARAVKAVDNEGREAIEIINIKINEKVEEI